MKQFCGFFNQEFSMSIHRKSLWIGNYMVIGLFMVALFTPFSDGPGSLFTGKSEWQEAGDIVYLFNMLVPLVTGILASDRLKRDFQHGIRELQSSTQLPVSVYILGKYLGVLCAVLMPMLISTIFIGGCGIIAGYDPFGILTGMLAAFVSISIPSMAFVLAFSLVCPLFMPVRVYQILFTGYWFWGNFLNSHVFPTISNTILNSSGVYALQGFFAGVVSRTDEPLHSAPEAWLNILVLCSCACITLVFAGHYITQKSRKI